MAIPVERPCHCVLLQHAEAEAMIPVGALFVGGLVVKVEFWRNERKDCESVCVFRLLLCVIYNSFWFWLSVVFSVFSVLLWICSGHEGPYRGP